MTKRVKAGPAPSDKLYHCFYKGDGDYQVFTNRDDVNEWLSDICGYEFEEDIVVVEGHELVIKSAGLQLA